MGGYGLCIVVAAIGSFVSEDLTSAEMPGHDGGERDLPAG